MRVGESTLFALRDKTGLLLVPRGTLVADEEQRQQLTARALYVDEADSEALKRAMAGKLHSMVQQNERLGRIAQARPQASDMVTADAANGQRLTDPAASWAGLQSRLAAVLRDPTQPDFAERLMQVQVTLLAQLNSDSDDALLVLVYGTTQEFRDYSVSHALLVTVLAELAARHLPDWQAGWRTSLRCAALSMNVAMGPLQNQLATQDTPVTAAQRAQIDGHAATGAEMMRASGVTDELWLGAVAMHHATAPGPLRGRPPTEQLARLIQRTDVFAARLSPRKRRTPLSATAAAKAVYLDENQQADEAGSTLIKAIGLYPPGCMVRLANGEIAVVLRRGRQGQAPVVAAVVNAHGIAFGEPVLRPARLAQFKVSTGVAAHDVKVRLNLTQLLAMA